MAVLSPSNVLMTVDSNEKLWFYTKDNKMLWGMDATGNVFYQKNLSNIDTLTQIAVRGEPYLTLYCTTESSKNVFIGNINTLGNINPLTWFTYITSRESTATIQYLILSKDGTVLYQIYTNDNIYGCIEGDASSALKIPGIQSAYAYQKSNYPFAITVVTQPTVMGNFECKTIYFVGPAGGPPATIGSPVEISSPSAPFAQLISE